MELFCLQALSKMGLCQPGPGSSSFLPLLLILLLNLHNAGALNSCSWILPREDPGPLGAYSHDAVDFFVF